MVKKPTWGGRRPGAGRRSGSPYGEPTRAVRLPVSLAPHMAELVPVARALRAGGLHLPAADPPAARRPLYGHKIPAGFPSPADDYVESMLDLNEHLVRHKEATFFLRVKGDSMSGANIPDGSLLIVDRSLTPRHGSIVVAEINRELTVKRLHKRRGEIKLLPANDAYSEILIKPGSELTIWGVVRHVVHSF